MATFTQRRSSRVWARWIVALSAVAIAALVVAGLRSSSPSLTLSAARVPTAPSKVSVAPGFGSVTLHWKASTSAKGLPVIHYIVTPYSGRTALAEKKTGDVHSLVVKGLVNGKAYSFHVAAANANGRGPARSSVVVTVGAPLAPTVISVKAGNRSSTVRWKPPAASNGSKITRYVVNPYRNGVQLPGHTFKGTVSSATLTGLTPGTSYTFTVSATNSFGTSLQSAPSAALLVSCNGVPMTHGQSDIDNHPGNTAFCLSGTHNWTLTPKSGDQLIGPATLNGGDSTNWAIVAVAPNVTLVSLTISHYDNGNGSQDAPIHVPDNQQAKQQASGWHLTDLNVGFNSASGSGSGDGWFFTGGRYHDNGQEGIGGAMGTSVTINDVEVDHNNFTDTSYSHRNWDCSDEAGGIKSVGNDLTVENSSIIDNACKGLWTDTNATNTKIINNRVLDNWDEGIFIEISSDATITGNTVSGNGFKDINGGSRGCGYLWGGGITLSTSDHVTVAHNSVSNNCNGITGIEQDRPDGNPGQLEDISVHDNTVSGAGKTGAAADNGANLRSRNINFDNNSVVNGGNFCDLSC